MEKETKICPYCGGEILAVAKKCKHCGEWLTDDRERPKIQQPVVAHPEIEGKGKLYAVFVLCSLIGGLLTIIDVLLIHFVWLPNIANSGALDNSMLVAIALASVAFIIWICYGVKKNRAVTNTLRQLLAYNTFACFGLLCGVTNVITGGSEMSKTTFLFYSSLALVAAILIYRWKNKDIGRYLKLLVLQSTIYILIFACLFIFN